MIEHLNPTTWARANRLLVRKALAEFAHERLLRPVRTPDGWMVTSDDKAVEYHFAARVMTLEHWEVDADSITRQRGGSDLPVDAVDFCTEMRATLGLSAEVLPVYLEEISSSLAGMCFKQSLPAVDLTAADFPTVEAGMTEGHPCFVANNGRLGFGIGDYHRYAPEAANPVRLVWLAAHRDHARFTSSADTDYASHIRGELGERTLAAFRAVLPDLDDRLLIPVHPWQWENKLSVAFAAEIATRRLVHLGEGPDEYRAQQSIRTFFNTSAPHKHYVKTALSILNMGFLRGLSAAYMAATPAINDWLADLIAGDEVLRATRLTILRERAAVGYHHRQYEAATDRYSPYRKMLAALWRESPVPDLEPGRRLATMASLLHTDAPGGSFAAALVAESGLPPRIWLRRYLDAYLTPLLHSFYAHDLAFMPHGENVIMVLGGGVVERVIFKDIAEEIVVMNPDADLPEAVARIKADIPDEMKLLSIFTDVFDCFLRFLSANLDRAGVLGQDAFWQVVADNVRAYQRSVPHLAAKLARYDLFAPEFALSCLNRLQLTDNRQMVDLADPAAALQLRGTLRNPLAP